MYERKKQRDGSLAWFQSIKNQAEEPSPCLIFFDWNASLQDAVSNPVASELLNNAIDTVGKRSSAVLLAHDRIAQTAEILNELLDYFADYSMETLTPDVAPVQFSLK